MCGIAGIVGVMPVQRRLYDALTVLQHRGQDAAGIVTFDEGRFNLRKDNGMVRDVFRQEHMEQLTGNSGIAHVRYPTAGCSNASEAQPFYVNSPFGIVLAHNGNLTNTEDLVNELFATDRRHINTESDSEILLNIFANELAREMGERLVPADVFRAVRVVHNRCRGAYGVVAMIAGFGMVAFRDPNAIRPVVYGTRETREGQEVMVASESVALDVLGFARERDLAPGEALVATLDG